jgi:hypothetical protein
VSDGSADSAENVVDVDVDVDVLLESLSVVEEVMSVRGPSIVLVLVLVGMVSRSGVLLAAAELTLVLMSSNWELASREFEADTVAVEEVRSEDEVSDTSTSTSTSTEIQISM